MKKFLSVVSLLMALMMLCTSALANEQKYDEPVTVHFVRSTDDTLDANYFSQHPDKTMTDNLWCDLFRDELNINVEYDWIVKSGDEYNQKLAAELAVGAIPEFVNVTALQAKQLYEAGLIMPLDEIYNEYATEQTKRVMLETGTSPFDAVLRRSALRAARGRRNADDCRPDVDSHGLAGKAEPARSHHHGRADCYGEGLR